MLVLYETFRSLYSLLSFSTIHISDVCVDESDFASEQELSETLDRIGGCGARTTGSKIHNELVQWLENELHSIPGLSIRNSDDEILRWQTKPTESLGEAGSLSLSRPEGNVVVPVAGAVPFSLPTTGLSGPLLYLPPDIPITDVDVVGKIILREFPAHPVPYPMVFLPAHSRTRDLDADLLKNYDRPGLADEPLSRDLIAAGEAGAAGMIIMFDIERSQIESYFEPHQGVHYQLPAVFVGADEAAMLRAEASRSTFASLTIRAEVSTQLSRNIFATLPGQTKERVIYQTHTDGNTFIQENGAVAVLALARYFAKQPLSARKRTIEFALTSGHLHISHEGSALHADNLDSHYDADGNLVLVIPMEHLGSREIDAFPRGTGKPGRELRFTGRGEIMFWCVGPSPPVVKAVQRAVARRKLDRVLITRGTSMPDTSRVPTFTSFGGIGTYYHNKLLPTTSLISGPWSLWAPGFGRDAVDISRMRSQILAMGDVYLAIQDVSRDEIAGGYRDYRQKRANGARTAPSLTPPEHP